MDDTSRVTRLEVRSGTTQHGIQGGPVVAYIEREHNAPDPWVLTVMQDEAWPNDLRTAAGAGRYTTTARTVEQADRVLTRAAAAVMRYLDLRRALDLSVRDEVSLAIKHGDTQPALLDE